MLESEARTKWCPMVRLIAVASNGATMLHINRDNNPDISPRLFCLGQHCACWVDTGYDDAAKERTGRCGLAR